MSEADLIGTTTISNRWRISAIKDLREEFEEMGEQPEVGDKLAFWRRGDDIVVELA